MASRLSVFRKRYRVQAFSDLPMGDMPVSDYWFKTSAINWARDLNRARILRRSLGIKYAGEYRLGVLDLKTGEEV